jgi:hypothetical protein
MKQWVIFFLVALLSMGCSRGEIRQYQTHFPETVGPMAEDLEMGMQRDVIPFAFGTELSVTSFPGQVGGALANVNRWLAQLGLPSVGEQALAQMMKTITIKGKSYQWVTLANQDTHQGMTVAFIFDGNNTTFYKLTGDHLALEKANLAFIKKLEEL